MSIQGEHYTELKKLIAELGLFDTSDGRFNGRAAIPAEFKQRCFDATPNCESPELRDRLYWILNDIHDYARCMNCGSRIVRKVKGFSDTFKHQSHCSGKCHMADPTMRAIYDQERLERTGYRSPMQNPEVRRKAAETNLARRGVTNPSQDKQVREKIRETVKARYGVDHVSKAAEVRLKFEQTCIDRYGVNNPMQLPIIRDAATATCVERYGVENPMQVEEFFRRAMGSRFKIKELVTQRGKVFKHQGFEDVALKVLLDNGVDEDDILTERDGMPSIFYQNARGYRSRYYPDIYVKSQHLLIEVKSLYTYNLQKEQTHTKQQACRDMGFNHIILLCTKNTIIQVI